MKLDLDLDSTWCNTWPVLTIKQHNNIVLEQEINQPTKIELELDYAPFSLGMFGKIFGVNHVWETWVDDNNNITHDKLIIINSFKLDDVEISDILHYLTMDTDQQGIINIYDRTLRFNGEWVFDITDSAYHWIIKTKNQNKKRTGESKSYFSDIEIVGDYTQHYEIIDRIKALMKQ